MSRLQFGVSLNIEEKGHIGAGLYLAMPRLEFEVGLVECGSPLVGHRLADAVDEYRG